jgi:hypothetical protein
MTRNSIAAALTALCLVTPAVVAPAIVTPALADDTGPDAAGGRYLFEKQSGDQASGYLRLDTKTGEVALCSQRSVGWACEAAPEDRAVLENEIARLRAENAALKRDLLSRGLPLPPGAMPEPPPPASGQLVMRLPSDADLDRMLAIVGQAWHRFVAAVERAQKQILNKS